MKLLSLLVTGVVVATRTVAHDGLHDSEILAGYAHPVSDNPPGTGYSARFDPDESSTISGRIFAVSDAMGIGTNFHVMLGGLPMGMGPFSYHVHGEPVPEDKNCTNVGAHFDPYGRGMNPPCAATVPASCEVGDLSGKHGSWLGEVIDESFFDIYVSVLPGSIAYVGNKSIVIHDAGGNRLTCATLEPFQLALSNCDAS